MNSLAIFVLAVVATVVAKSIEKTEESEENKLKPVTCENSLGLNGIMSCHSQCKKQKFTSIASCCEVVEDRKTNICQCIELVNTDNGFLGFITGGFKTAAQQIRCGLHSVKEYTAQFRDGEEQAESEGQNDSGEDEGQQGSGEPEKKSESGKANAEEN